MNTYQYTCTAEAPFTPDRAEPYHGTAHPDAVQINIIEHSGGPLRLMQCPHCKLQWTQEPSFLPHD